MPKIRLEIITDEPVGVETAIHLLNETDFEVLRTEKDYNFSMTRKVKEEGESSK